MKLILHEFDLPLRHVFTISRGSIEVQKTLIVELQQDGISGDGEATTNDYYGFTLENIATREETYSGAAAVMAEQRRDIYGKIDCG